MHYVVEAGDSPQKIAEKFTRNPHRMSELLVANGGKELVSLNGIPTFASLHVGEKITIPQSWGSDFFPGALGQGPKYRFLTVRAGDTVMSIAQSIVGDASRFWELVAANPQKARVWTGSAWTFQTLTAGEKLRIPTSWNANLGIGGANDIICEVGFHPNDDGTACVADVQEACAPGYHRQPNGFCVPNDVPPPPPTPPNPPAPPPPPTPTPPTPPVTPPSSSSNLPLILGGLALLGLVGIAVAASSTTPSTETRTTSRRRGNRRYTTTTTTATREPLALFAR